MKKFLSSMFGKTPIGLDSNHLASSHHNEAERGRVEDYMSAYSDTDAVWYYERRRWRV